MKLEVMGAIISNDDKWIYDWLDMDSTSPKDIVNSLPSTNEDLDVIINSGGGDVYAGSEIYTALKEYPGKVNIKIVGIAASAASVIAMAGHVTISPTAQIMIHNVSSFVAGDNRAMQHEADVLKGFNESIASAYVDKTNQPLDDILELMNKETWLTAQQAVELGFADEVMFSENAPKLVATTGGGLSPEVINRMKTIMNKEPVVNVNVDMDEIVNKVIEKMNTQNEPPKPQNTGFGRFVF
ncbi:head maturation protease, ClpP-related [Kurthia huakuii]|uniref:head maturation protease, ClpP-related n=1 Tax=Kurthia huakuii TaxID=1421019 RepID=UPI000495F964|nr:head maturation protease, ClpP-related [Kurthia huakuii]MBM7698678.1 ATP-dependent Clp protease protease subunit [Kurthia huakuii]